MMQKKVIIIISILILFEIVFTFQKSYAKYNSSASAELEEFSYAKFVFNGTETSDIDIDLDKIKPGDTLEYDFSVKNNDGSVRSDVNIGYKITILTMHNIPVNVDLYKGSNKIFTCDENYSRNSDNYIECITPNYFLNYSDNSEDTFKLIITYPSVDSDGNTWSYTYADLSDSVTIKLNSWQKN